MRRLSAHELELALAFKLAFHGRPCAIHDDPSQCEFPIQVCHLIPKQALRRRGLAAEVTYDPRNALPACYRAHRRSDSGIERFPADRIPDEAWEFASELGLGWMLERLYGAEVAA